MATILRRTPYPSFRQPGKYKQRLREDFSYACAYCTVHENEWGGLWHFHVEHFRPKSKFPKLATSYENLLYSCDVCNCYKRDDWPSDNPLADGRGYLDPCEHDYSLHFSEDVPTGKLCGHTAPARYMVELLHLNRGYLVRLRAARTQETSLIQEYTSLCDQALARIDLRLHGADVACEEQNTLVMARQVICLFYGRLRQEWDTHQKPESDASDYR
jgi:uncharacterized protein (TIGR02646 family)